MGCLNLAPHVHRGRQRRKDLAGEKHQRPAISGKAAEASAGSHQRKGGRQSAVACHKREGSKGING